MSPTNIDHRRIANQQDSDFPPSDPAFTLAMQGALPIVDLFNRAQTLTAEHKAPQAIALYRTWIQNSISPVAYAALFNLAVLLINSGDEAGAETAYRSAISIKPDFVEGNFGLATLLERMGRTDEAISLWRSVLIFTKTQNKTLYVQILNHLGQLFSKSQQLSQAHSTLELCIKENPIQPTVLMQLQDLRQQLCIWPLTKDLEGVPVSDLFSTMSRQAVISATDDPAQHLESARRHVKAHIIKIVHGMSSKQSYGHLRIRVGYLTSDTSPCDVPSLISSLFALHDQSKFEVFHFHSSGNGKLDKRARKISTEKNHFEIGDHSDDQAACLIRQHEIDILIDLQGIATNIRYNIYSYRPAPIQVTWLGMPGTLAHPDVDYIIADEYVLPTNLEPFVTEKPLRVPHTYFFREFPPEAVVHTTRENEGLPVAGFVFGCFDKSFRINEETFRIWMEILQSVPNSVFWLLIENREAQENINLAAEKVGVSRNRIVFASLQSAENHLARYQCIDLVLCCVPGGDGALVTEAIWSGVPALTYAGKTFASRIAGSLLNAIDMPELILSSLDAYKASAIALGNDRQALGAIKNKLIKNRHKCSLFDSHSFVEALEKQYIYAINALPVMPKKICYSPHDLAYLRPLGENRHLDTGHHAPDRRYVIVAPPFQHNSAGIRVLYDLQKWLVCAGLDAIVCTWFPGYPVEQFVDDIVIYPEVAPGNLLNAKHVVRYILNVPGKLGYGEKQYDKDEVLIAYNRELAPYANGAILQVPSIESFFHAHGAVKTKNAVFVGKGQDLSLHPHNCVAITKTFPHSRREVAELLRSVETLYMYDDFSMIAHEARLCGCTVKLIQKDGVVVDYPQMQYPTTEEFLVQLHTFIEMTRGLSPI